MTVSTLDRGQAAPVPTTGRVPEWLGLLGRLAVGIIGTAAGLGIGIPWTTKTGWSVTTVAGVVCLVAGLVALVSAAAGLIRLVHGWWRLAAIPVGLVLLAYVVLPLAMAVAATVVPPTSIGLATPASHGLVYEDVRFPAADGVVLSGWYVPSANGAAVALLHGSGSTRSAVLGHAAVLARHGYGVLLFDARGHGRSDGRAMDFGWYGDDDLAGAVSWLSSRADVHDGRIAAVGMSMGGEEAIGAAGTDPRIRAVVAEGATNRAAADKAWLDDEFGLRGRLQQGIEWMVYSMADLFTPAGPPASLRSAARGAAPRPMLLIAAGKIADERLAARWIQSASPSTVDVWVVPNASHTSGITTDAAGWESRVTSFLNASLGRH